MAPITELNHETKVSTPSYKSVVAAVLLGGMFLAGLLALVNTSVAPTGPSACVADTVRQPDGTCVLQER